METITEPMKTRIEILPCRKWDIIYFDFITDKYLKILNGLKMRSEKVSNPNHPTLILTSFGQGTPPFLKGGENKVLNI